MSISNTPIKVKRLLTSLLAASLLTLLTLGANAQQGPADTISPPKVGRGTAIVLAQVEQPAEAEPAPAAPEEQPTVEPTGAETPAVEQPAEEEKDPFQFRAYQSTGYSINVDHPSTDMNTYRVYDFDDRRLKFDLLDLDFQYNVAKPDGLGFRVEATAGQSHPRIDSSLGLFRDFDTGISNTGFDLRQFYLTYMTEGGVRFDLGKFPTHIGYEVMDGVDGANSEATRSWAFLYGPFTHTGGKVSYAIDDHWSIAGIVTLGWDQFRDANDSISFGGQLGYAPTSDFSVYLNFITGPEQSGNNSDSRTLFDITTAYQVAERVKIGANLLWGREDNFVGPGDDGSWSGVVGYLDTKITDKFGINLRYEWFNDPDGTRTGTGQYLDGFTISPHYDFNDNWMTRVDLRFDTSSQDVFDNGGLPAASQSTLFLNNVLRF